MKTITLITGNPKKKLTIQDIFSKNGIKLEIASLDHDKNFQEPQLWNCEDIALHSAKYAMKVLQRPVITSDVGYYFDTFGNGFPGPYIKWFNEGLNADDILRLMEGKENRKVTLKNAVAFCDCEGNEKVFLNQDEGYIAKERSKNKGWTPINEVLVLKGMDKPVADHDELELLKHWTGQDGYKELVVYLKKLWQL